MPATLPRTRVKDGDRLDYEGLRQKAKEAVKASGMKQYEVAERVGRTGPSVSLALSQAGARYAGLQRVIIEALTDFRIREERSVDYVVEGK